MKPGFNVPRADRNDYMRFVEDLKAGLASATFDGVKINDVSCLLYGSYSTGTARYGNSPVDALFTFCGSTVIDKRKLRAFSDIVARAKRFKHVPFNPIVVDSGIMRDGRFNPFNVRYAGYFEREAIVISGDDPRCLFRFETPEHPEQGNVRRALALSRRTLLMHDYYAGNTRDLKPLDDASYEVYLNAFDRALEEISRSSERIIAMADGGFRYHDRFVGVDLIPNIFQDVDVRPLMLLQLLMSDNNKLDRLYKDPTLVRATLEGSIGFLESLIAAYIRTRPNIELKDSNW